MQNFKPVVWEGFPRRDSLDLVPKTKAKKNEEIIIPRRLYDLRSSRLVHSAQNFKLEVEEGVPRPDLLELVPNIINNLGRDCGRRNQNKEMVISQRREDIGSSRLVHSIQNFKLEV